MARAKRNSNTTRTLLTCHRASSHSERRSRALTRGTAHCAGPPVARSRWRQRTAPAFRLRMSSMQPPTAAPSAPPCAALRADAGAACGGRSRRRSPGARLAALALALACAAASLQVAAAKPLASLAIMKLNQIDPTVRRVAGRRNCAQRCCAVLWGLRGPSAAAARCASACVPMQPPRRLPAACGWRSAERRARPGGRERAVRKRQSQS